MEGSVRRWGEMRRKGEEGKEIRKEKDRNRKGRVMT